jgi:aminopeptidase YwaD
MKLSGYRPRRTVIFLSTFQFGTRSVDPGVSGEESVVESRLRLMKGVGMKRASVVSIVSFTCLMLCLLAASAPAASAESSSPGRAFDRAVAKLMRQHYPQKVEAYLDSLGTCPLGFRLAGTPSDNAAADYIAAQWNRVGLVGVAEEPVPVDVWDVRGAAVRVAGRTLVASQFDGVPGTAPGGVDGQVVYAGDGTAQDFNAAGDVSGKIVLIDSNLDNYWFNMPAGEATLRGAKAVVMTRGPNSSWWYRGLHGETNVLGAGEATYFSSYLPMVYISKADGDWLKSRLKAGPVQANVSSDVQVTMHQSGGVGYNVIGRIDGSDPAAGPVVFLAHHDCHFRPGIDNTSGVATELLIAKAMKLSGYRPRRTVIFLSTTAEEFGYTDCAYDFCTGSWWAATQAHPDWAGTAVATIDLDAEAARGTPLEVSASPDLKPWLARTARSNPGYLPWGWHVSTPLDDGIDSWPFMAAGIPSFDLQSAGGAFWYVYHTNDDTPKLVCWSYLARIAKLARRYEASLDRGLLPFDLASQARDFSANISAAELKGAGADTGDADAFAQALAGYKAACAAYQSRRPHIPAAHRNQVNAELLSLVKEWNTCFAGQDAWQDPVYVHQQVLSDANRLNHAIAMLQAAPVDAAKAVAVLDGVGRTWYGEHFSYPVYQQDLTHFAPGYPLLTWAAMVTLPPQLDVMPQIADVRAADYADAVAGLTTTRDQELLVLDQIVQTMSATLTDMTPKVAALK